MKMLAALAVLALALPTTDASAAPAARKAIRKAPVNVDWTKRVTVTPAGGFLVGNPDAKTTFVEYASLSCPYCQRFHQEATTGLRARIATGKVNFEFRPFAVHSADPILHALLRCAGPARFNKFADDFYEGQTTLTAVYEKWAEANPTVDATATAADRVKYAHVWGFTTFATSHGLTRTQATACVSNAKAIYAQRQLDDKANAELGVTGTPTFFLNGQKLSVYTWAAIDQAIGAAIAS